MKKKILALIVVLMFAFVGCGKVHYRNDKKISRYFTYRDATRSSYAERHRINNDPPREDYKRIVDTARRLDRIRRIVGEPMIVTSWYRGRRLNRAVGGSRTSAHGYGLAVDFQIKGNGKRAYDKILKSGYSFDQLYYYKGRNHIHIGFRENIRHERKQAQVKW